MEKSLIRPVVVWVLFLLLVLLGFGAVISGWILMLAPDGSIMHMPLSIMQGSPFSSFFIPGLILFLLLGVYPLCIAYGLWEKPAWTWPDAINPFKSMHWSWAGSLAAAVIVILWLSVELIWVGYSFLHTTYYVIAGLIILLTLLPATRDYLRRN